MTVDLTLRLGEIAAALAERMPGVLNATIALLESIAPLPNASRSYEIKHQIGTGGQAEVFLGIVRGAHGFARPVAIKRVRPDLISRPLTVMLTEEALLTAKLSHPNVVSVIDFARDAEDRPYLVMEYIDGVDLATLIETGPLPEPVAIFIMCELLSELGYIHHPSRPGPKSRRAAPPRHHAAERAAVVGGRGQAR